VISVLTLFIRDRSVSTCYYRCFYKSKTRHRAGRS